MLRRGGFPPGWVYRLLVVALLAGCWFVLRTPEARSPGPVSAAGGYDWLQFNGDPQHSGDNRQESNLTASNVASLGQVFQATLPAVADGAPAYLRNVSTSTGIHDMLFLTTKAGDILALDAHSGNQIWIQHNPAGTCRINNGGSTCYTTSSPAIDPSRAFVYSYGLDGKAHKYAVGSGSEVLAGGWPEVTTVKDFDEKGSAALSVATAADGTSWVFVANGNGIAGLKLVISGGAPSLQAAWHQAPGGTSPIVANGVLYYAAGGSSIRALVPVSGGVPLWQGTIGGIHWESPIVANGMIYSADENAQLTAFGLPASPTATPTPTSTATATVIACPTATPTDVATSTPAPTNTPRATRTAIPLRIYLPELAEPCVSG